MEHKYFIELRWGNKNPIIQTFETIGEATNRMNEIVVSLSNGYYDSFSADLFRIEYYEHEAKISHLVRILCKDGKICPSNIYETDIKEVLDYGL